MINIITQKFKEQKTSILCYVMGLLIYTWLLVGMFPTMQQSGLQDLVKSMPEQYMKFFGGDGFMSYSTIQGFLSIEYLSFFFILIIAFYLGSSAGSAITGPIEKKTIDYELSLPISRTKFALSSFLVGIFFSAILIAFNAFFIWFLCNIYNVQISSHGLFAFAITAIFFVWAIYGIGAFFSSIFKSKLSVVLITVMIPFGFYVFTSLTNIIDKLKDYDHYSLFYLYNPQKLLMDATINWNHITILVAILFVGLTSSLIIFNKKDL